MTGPGLAAELDAVRGAAVPVIGAGLASGCGAPSSPSLAVDLAAAASDPTLASLDLYDVANELEVRFGTEWVQAEVARITLAATLTATPLLQSVTLVNRRIVATTNYDDAIEVAARQHHLRTRTLTPADLRTLAAGPDDDELFVVHLHGTAHRPESIILTKDSYALAEHDEQLKTVVRTLALSASLVFLGHRLAENEVHLRRDVRTAVELFGPGGHLLLHAPGVVADPTQFEVETGVRPIGYPNPNRDHAMLGAFARRLGAPPLAAPTSKVRRSPSSAYEAAHEPMPVAPPSEVATDEGRTVWQYRWLVDRTTPPTTVDLQPANRILIGRPGCGKTQALLRGASRTDRGVYVRLPSVGHPVPGQSPEALIVQWVHRAGESRHDLAIPTKDSLATEAYDFFLDGLDEVPGSHRGQVVDAIGRMAEAMPQHSWTIASRPLAELQSPSISEFTQDELVPTRAWTERFAEQHGVSRQELHAALDANPALASMIDVPLFAAATIEALKANEALPSSALEMLLHFASRGLATEEPRMGVDADAVERWLDRLALAQVCAGADSSDHSTSTQPALADSLDATLLSDLVVSRVLLIEGEASYRFPIRPIRDARAAREMSRLGEHSGVLEVYGLVDPGTGRRHLRPDWQFVADLLAESDKRWRALIGLTDPPTAARAVVADQPSTADLDAAESLVQWYRDKQIHLPKTSPGQVRDDLEALRLLAGRTHLAPLVPALRSDLRSPTAPIRGNAVSVLALIGVLADGDPELSLLVHDPDPVVQRRAAAAIGDQKLSSYTHELLSAATQAADELARQALIEHAIQVAPSTEIERIIAGLSRRQRSRVAAAIDERLPPPDQLRIATRTDPLDDDWIEHVASLDHDWTPAEVSELMAAMCRDATNQHHPAVRRLMTEHPHAALRGALRGGLQPTRAYTVLPALAAASQAELDNLVATGDQTAVDLIDQYHRYATHSHAPGPPVGPLQRDVVQAAVVGANLPAVLDTHPSVDDLEALDDHTRAQLKGLVEQAWHDPARLLSPLLAVTRAGPLEWNCSGFDFALVDLAMKLRIDLTEDEWFHAASLLLGHQDETEAMRDAFDPAWTPRLLSEIAGLEPAAIGIVARSVPVPVDRLVAEALASAAFTSTDQDLQQTVSEVIAESGLADILEQWAARAPTAMSINRALLAFSNPDAEQRLLADFAASGCPAPGHHSSEKQWFDGLTSEQNAASIQECLLTMLRRGDGPHELGLLFRALNRSGGVAVGKFYEALTSDSTVPDAAFLYYQQQEHLASIPPHAGSVAEAATSLFGRNGSPRGQSVVVARHDWRGEPTDKATSTAQRR